MTGDPMVSIFFFFNTNDRFYVLMNIVKNLSRCQTTELEQLVAPYQKMNN